MKKPAIFTLALLIPLMLNAADMTKDTVLLNFLPEESPSWTIESEKVYNTDVELFDYINGGAELYLHYGFRQLAKRIYHTKGKATIKAEIFDMQKPENAYGVYSYSRDTTNTDIGQGGQYIGGSLIFWKDRYFISVFAQKETPAGKKKVLETGRKIEKAIKSAGKLPDFFGILPENSLIKGTSFYFRHPAWQNKFRYIAQENIFNINDKTRAYFAKYGNRQNRHYLMLLEYPNAKAARKGYKKGRSQLAKGLKKQPLVQDKDEVWLGCERHQRLVMVVLDAPQKDIARYLLDKTAENYDKIR